MQVRSGFTDMRESTEEDWKIIVEDFRNYSSQLADRVLAHLKLLHGDFGGFSVDRLTHSLQTATRAHRDGKDEEYVVCSLLHDIGDTLGSFNHPDIAAAILKRPPRKNPAHRLLGPAESVAFGDAEAVSRPPGSLLHAEARC